MLSGTHGSVSPASCHRKDCLVALRCGPKPCSAPNPNAEMSNGKTAQGKVKPILGRIKIICALSVLVG